MREKFSRVSRTFYAEDYGDTDKTLTKDVPKGTLDSHELDP